MDPDELTRQLSQRGRDAGQDATGWFDELYRAAGEGQAQVPWDRGTPNPLLVDWVAQQDTPLGSRFSSAAVVGAGYGRDAEYLASLGVPVTAFDVSAAAVEQTRARFPASSVEYVIADLLALPASWLSSFPLVVESMTVQALPEPPRGRATQAVSSLVAPGGTLLVVAAGFDGTTLERDAEGGPPWPLVRHEVEAFATEDLALVSLERVEDDAMGGPGLFRWRAELLRGSRTSPGGATDGVS